MKFMLCYKRIRPGYYEVYTFGACEPFAIIYRTSSRRWRIYDRYFGTFMTFRSLSQCKAFFDNV